MLQSGLRFGFNGGCSRALRILEILFTVFAVIVFIVAGLGAGGILGLGLGHAVLQRGLRFGFNGGCGRAVCILEILFTFCAVIVLVITSLGAGCILGLDFCRAVAIGRQGHRGQVGFVLALVIGEELAAGATLIVCGVAGRGTGGSIGRNLRQVMGKHGDHDGSGIDLLFAILILEVLGAVLALVVRDIALLGTGGSTCRNILRVMAGGRFALVFHNKGIVTITACICYIAVFCAGRSCFDSNIIMLDRDNCFVQVCKCLGACFIPEVLLTHIALIIFLAALNCAGCFFCREVGHGVGGHGDRFCYFVAAAISVTNLIPRTLLRAAFILRHDPIAIAVAQGRHIVSHIGVVALGTCIGGVALLGTGRIGLNCRVSFVAGCGDDFRIAVAAVGAGVSSHTGSGTGGRGRNRISIARAVTQNPLAVGATAVVAVSTASRGGGVGTIAVQQLCGSNGNFGIGIGILNILIRHRIRCSGDFYLGTFHAGDRGAAGGGIELSSGSIQDAIHNHLCVNQICCRAGIGLAGRIDNRDKLDIALASSAVAIVAPFILIVDIDRVTGAQCAGNTFCNLNFRAGNQSHILIQSDGAAVDLDGNIAVDIQHIIRGTHRCSTDLHLDGRNGHIAISFHNQAVSASVIALGHIAAGQIEHTATGADERHGGAKGGAGHINGGIAVFLGTGIQGQGNFDVLDIVLAQGENLICNVRCGTAAAEVHDLEHFVDGGTAVGGDGAGAGDIAVGVQRTSVVHGDVTAAGHLHKADFAGGGADTRRAALGIALLGRKAHGAVDDQVGTFRQGQSAVGGGSCICTGADHSCGIQGVGIVKGDQQGDAAGDGIFSRRQGGTVHQDNCLAGGGCAVLRGLIQIVKQMGTGYIIIVHAGAEHVYARHRCAIEVRALGRCTNHKPGIAAILGEDSLDSHIHRGKHRERRISRQQTVIFRVNPADKGTTRGGSGRQSNTSFRHRAGITRRNRTTRYRNAAHAAVIDELSISLFDDFNIRNLQTCLITATKATLTFKCQCDKDTIIQLSRCIGGRTQPCASFIITGDRVLKIDHAGTAGRIRNSDCITRTLPQTRTPCIESSGTFANFGARISAL